MSSILSRRQLRLAALSALQTIAGVPVLSPGDWDTPSVNLPEIKLRCGDDRKASVTKTIPEFTTTVTLEISARLEADTAALAQDAIEALGEQVEEAIFGNVALVKLCQQFSTVITKTEVTSDGRKHFGGLQMFLDCEVFEAFDPIEINPSDYGALTSVGIHVDLVNVVDKTATYASPPFPASVTPAPRTSGPDGRDEGALLIPLPT